MCIKHIYKSIPFHTEWENIHRKLYVLYLPDIKKEDVNHISNAVPVSYSHPHSFTISPSLSCPCLWSHSMLSLSLLLLYITCPPRFVRSFVYPDSYTHTNPLFVVLYQIKYRFSLLLVRVVFSSISRWFLVILFSNFSFYGHSQLKQNFKVKCAAVVAVVLAYRSCWVDARNVCVQRRPNSIKWLHWSQKKIRSHAILYNSMNK